MRHLPERTCIGCRTKRLPHELLRLRCTPQGNVFPDIANKGVGRGAHVCFNADCLRRALTPGKLSAALKQTVEPPEFDSVYDAATLMITARLRSTIGLAQKSGAAISGATPLQKALAQKRVRYLILAQDIAASRAAEYHAWCAQLDIPWLTLFSKAELGQLLGKADRSAVGLVQASFGEQLSTTLETLHQLRSPSRSSGAPSELTIQPMI